MRRRVVQAADPARLARKPRRVCSGLLIVRRIAGESMLPGFLPDSIVVASSLYIKLRIGDVIVFSHQGRQKIKRVTGIDDGKLYVCGDNTASSTDSRHFGWLSQENVLGKVYWPKPTR